ncbi:DUF4328 domain-containing protein [Sphingomonas immobilis]|uniref:DUF4328 domain-containing protein n=1 Tax=Sphingomonas immobilis TaxID=3063997 RepID=A0ABT9A2X8_9SPHN|nr:DUF4328 domain-containing protein [Sphingomonas sp. CA1-15]MDO7843082.1 DUF4328 domain-containing protein [Sphingomonas sp. CA1-15]
MERLEGRRLAATIAVFVWLAADALLALSGMLRIAALQGGVGHFWSQENLERVDLATTVSGVAYTIAFIASILFVSLWIYRANANAHTLSDKMTISPGWNIGWFFIPIACWFNPFKGLRETWQASFTPDDPENVDAPAFMRWWWGLWIVTNLLGNASFQVSTKMKGIDGLILGGWLDVASFAIDLPMTLLLVRLMQQLTARQDGFNESGRVAVYSPA